MTETTVNFIQDALIFFQNASWVETIIVSFLVLGILCSATLIGLMVKYQGKNRLDLSLLFREISIIAVIGQTLLWRVWEIRDEHALLIGYMSFSVACLLVVGLIAHEHYVNRNTLPDLSSRSENSHYPKRRKE